jgi:polyhydroxybutyrate depolymerase
LLKAIGMMKKILLSVIAAISFSISFSQEFSLIHDGLVRTYRLYIPPGYDPDSIYPLVINMHGLGSNAFEQEVYTAFDSVADTAGIIVVYPNGINETWNISTSTGTDDVGFISALIDTIDYQYNIDLDRVFATGISMGGFMSYRLACELSNRIAAIASVAGLQAFYPCNPARPVPVLQFHGTLDPVVPYSGVPTTISNWVNYDLCPSDPTITELPDIDTSDNSTVTVYHYGPCEESTEVMLYTINGGEHTWPGATIIIGITNEDIKASNEIWNFFKKFTLQGSTGMKSQTEQFGPSCRFYPNPVHNLATVEVNNLPFSRFNFKIYDIAGNVVLEQNELTDSRFIIDCSRIKPGFYIALVSSDTFKSFQKLIIR